MALVINQQEKESVVVLKLSGKLTSEEECDAFNKQIEDLLQEAKNKIILNLEEVNFCNSSGLGCLVRALESTRRQNGDLKLLSPSQNVQNLLDLTMSGTVFDIHSTEVEAVASFKSLTSLKGLAMKTNKRRKPRITTDLIAQVEILPQKTTLLGRLANLNKEGVLFRTADKADPGTKVNVRFNLSLMSPGVPVRAEGVVVHSKEGVHMGIQFSSLQEADAYAITKYIEDKSS